MEFESADDFVLGTETEIGHVSFTGLLTGGATPKDVRNVVVEIYRVFPNDSNVRPDLRPADIQHAQGAHAGQLALRRRVQVARLRGPGAQLSDASPQPELHRPGLGVQCRQDQRQVGG